MIVYAAPGLPEDEVLGLLRLDGPVAETTRARGQLVLSGMRELLGPGRAFTAARQTGRLREETDRAVGEGFTGLRTYIDMRWVADLDVDIATMVDRETHADHLFDDRPTPRSAPTTAGRSTPRCSTRCRGRTR
ncbi:MEDS domain-containing protein [Streptomyces sp. M19]